MTTERTRHRLLVGLEVYRQFSKWLPVVQAIAELSKDPSRKIGAIIFGPDGEIRSTGYNGFARKVEEMLDRWSRPAKYQWVIHAEENAIAQAARAGVSTKGCLLMVSGLHPCHRCANLIVQAGIDKVLSFPADVNDERWGEEFKRAKQVFDEARVLQWDLPQQPKER